ncbi:MAG: ABC transporter substrate-binding protein [Gemmatimonadales bacterium]
MLVLLVACRAAGSHPAGPVVVVDDAGDTTRLAAPAGRIVSLSPTTTELLFAIGAGVRLVGRTHWDDFPPRARSVPDVGDAMPPNIEAVLARRPDLVLLYHSAQNATAARRFRDAGAAVLQLRMDRLEDVPRLARLLGPLVGAPDAADSLADAFGRALAAATDTAGTGAPGVLLLAWDQPPIAIGAGSFQSEILRRAGGRNIYSDLPSPSATVSLESIVARDPDLILVTDSAPPAFAGRPEWQSVRAVREHRFLHFTNPAFARPGPRSPEVIRELRAALQRAVP